MKRVFSNAHAVLVTASASLGPGFRVNDVGACSDTFEDRSTSMKRRSAVRSVTFEAAGRTYPRWRRFTTRARPPWIFSVARP